MDKVEKVMKEFKSGKLHSGSKHGSKVTSRAQAIAIGISEKAKALKNAQNNMAKSIREQLGMNHKAHALKHKTGEQLKKTHHSSEYCRHCGVKTRMTTTHESGHREFDHVDVPGPSTGMKIVR